jgi:hypothetical protein
VEFYFWFLPALVSKTTEEEGRIIPVVLTWGEGRGGHGRLAFTYSFRAQDEPEIRGHALRVLSLRIIPPKMALL